MYNGAIEAGTERKQILLTNDYDAEPFEIIKKCVPDGFALLEMDQNDPSIAAKADYILASGRMKVNAALLAQAKNLKMIQRTGVGLDSLDLDAIKSRGIPLYVNQGVNAQSVAEHTILLMLACLRKLPKIHQNTANGIWSKQKSGIQTAELKGKTVGLVGMGHISRIIAGILQGFDVTVLYYDVVRQNEDCEKALQITYCDFEALLAQADILSLHCPLTDTTRGLMNKDSIAQMKDGAVFINTARGGLVKTSDLIDALHSGKVSCAGLDVHEVEPLPKDSPILQQQNVILTPHIGGITLDSFQEMMMRAMQNIYDFEHGKFDCIAAYQIIE